MITNATKKNQSSQMSEASHSVILNNNTTKYPANEHSEAQHAVDIGVLQLEQVGILAHCKSGMSFNQALLYLLFVRQRTGRTCLPVGMGLSDTDFSCFLKYILEVLAPDCESNQFLRNYVKADKAGDLRLDLLNMRRDEWQDIVNLLVQYRRIGTKEEFWLAEILAAGCLGGDHLWRDLGLLNRESLSLLLHLNFPSLAALNNRDMKWKKFFYKQLCETEGSYVCRAPSCEQCAAYKNCFGPEN